jgi:hypothetical protein
MMALAPAPDDGRSFSEFVSVSGDQHKSEKSFASRIAVDRPMPWLAPVTIATLVLMIFRLRILTGETEPVKQDTIWQLLE